MVKAQTPTIAKIKNTASQTEARALISLAICEVCDFFNVGKNMNDFQVAMTAELIIERFWYLRVEEVKYCFHRAMRTQKVYDRLDGNIILGWLEEYDNERTEEAMRISDQEAAMCANTHAENPDAVSFEDFSAMLKQKAAAGDKDAEEMLADIDKFASSPTKSQRDANKHQADLAFFKWKESVYNRYERNKKQQK